MTTRLDGFYDRMKRKPDGAPRVAKPRFDTADVQDLIPLAILMFLFIVNCIVGFAFLEEDAFIDFRYASNLADGHGFVFNPGEEPVEGFSNFLWLGILYLFRDADADVVAVARVLGILLGAGTMYMSYIVTRQISGRHGALCLVAPAMIAFSPPLIYWYQAGLESALFSLLIVALVFFHLKENDRAFGVPPSGIICFLLAITRPEGIIFFILFTILKFRPAMKDDRKMRSYIAFFFSCFIPLLLFVVFRYSTFHSLLPNTYYAKVLYTHAEALRIGGLYILAFFSDSRAWLWLIPFLVVLFRVRGEALGRSMLPFIVFIAYTLFVLYVGGDFHIHFRFFAPLMPLLFIAATTGLWEIWASLDETANAAVTRIVTVIIVVVVLIVSCVFYRSPAWRDIEQVNSMDRSMLSYRYQSLIADPGKFGGMLANWAKPPGDILDKAGKWLVQQYPPETKLATEQCGKVPYYTQFHTYDLLGLNNAETARIIHYNQSFEKYRDAFFNADPDIVLLYFADGKFVDMQHIGRLVESKEFQDAYKLVKILDFDYIYILDKEYHRSRQMLLFERKTEVSVEEAVTPAVKPDEEPAPPEPPKKIDELIKDLLEPPEIIVDETKPPVESGEEIVSEPPVEKFVVKL